jgi:BirA family biotin operon repressor/biotin-[acetyl-CoA-carboxylase] ligase
VSLAVYEVVNQHFVGQVKIKWPNDIYLKDRKVGGILIQNGVQGSVLQWSVLGLGLNINQYNFSENLSNATSFSRETGEIWDLDEIRTQLFHSLDSYYSELKRSTTMMDELYVEALYRRAILTTFTVLNGQPFVGTIQDVDSLGRLRVRDQQNNIRLFNLKEIRYP